LIENTSFPVRISITIGLLSVLKSRTAIVVLSAKELEEETISKIRVITKKYLAIFIADTPWIAK